MNKENLAEVKNYFLQNYLPAKNISEMTLHLSLQELSEKLSKMNGEYVDEETVSAWLHEGEYIFLDFGKMNFEYIFKSN